MNTHLCLFSGIGGFSLAARLRALGNAVVPQHAYIFFAAIADRIREGVEAE